MNISTVTEPKVQIARHLIASLLGPGKTRCAAFVVRECLNSARADTRSGIRSVQANANTVTSLCLEFDEYKLRFLAEQSNRDRRWCIGSTNHLDPVVRLSLARRTQETIAVAGFDRPIGRCGSCDSRRRGMGVPTGMCYTRLPPGLCGTNHRYLLAPAVGCFSGIERSTVGCSCRQIQDTRAVNLHGRLCCVQASTIEY